MLNRSACHYSLMMLTVCYRNIRKTLPKWLVGVICLTFQCGAFPSDMVAVKQIASNAVHYCNEGASHTKGPTYYSSTYSMCIHGCVIPQWLAARCPIQPGCKGFQLQSNRFAPTAVHYCSGSTSHVRTYQGSHGSPMFIAEAGSQRK